MDTSGDNDDSKIVVGQIVPVNAGDRTLKVDFEGQQIEYGCEEERYDVERAVGEVAGWKWEDGTLFVIVNGMCQILAIFVANLANSIDKSDNYFYNFKYTYIIILEG